jgi:mRNA interferase MazF
MSLQLFDHWNEQKKITHQSKIIPSFRIREIWWAQLGRNISSESLGKGKDFLRPVLILQKFYGNSALVIPLTSQPKKGNYYFQFNDKNKMAQVAILPQIRYMDGRRLKRKISTVPSKTFSEMQDKLFSLIKNNPCPEGQGILNPDKSRQEPSAQIISVLL